MMSSWILSVSATALLTAIVSLIVPKGKTGGIIKCVFSIITILVIMRPLVNMKDIQFDFSLTEGNDIVIQDDFIDYSVSMKTLALENDVENLLKNNGVSSAKVQIYAKNDDNSFSVKRISINLEKAVINSDKVNIDIIDEIADIVSLYVGVEKEVISIYGYQ